jgi:hypothetical protein
LLLELERYCRGLDGWPLSWIAWEKDLPPGLKLGAGGMERIVHDRRGGAGAFL